MLTTTFRTQHTLRTQEQNSNKEREEMGYAVKIIEIAEGNQTFTLNEGALKKILHEVPEGMEIAIVSVVSVQAYLRSLKKKSMMIRSSVFVFLETKVLHALLF